MTKKLILLTVHPRQAYNPSFPFSKHCPFEVPRHCWKWKFLSAYSSFFLRTWRIRGKDLCVHVEDAKRLFAYSPNTPKEIKVYISQFIIKQILNLLRFFLSPLWDGLSQKTISRYCPFNAPLHPPLPLPSSRGSNGGMAQENMYPPLSVLAILGQKTSVWSAPIIDELNEIIYEIICNKDAQNRQLINKSTKTEFLSISPIKLLWICCSSIPSIGIDAATGITQPRDQCTTNLTQTFSMVKLDIKEH
jgi:hypothetical protein